MKRIFFQTSKGKISILYFPNPDKKKPVIHWSHANGFNALAYKKFLTKLSTYYHVYAWDARGHGKTNLNANFKDKLFDTFNDDLQKILIFLNKKHEKKIICAGHSFGATLSLISANKKSNIIEKILLVDPVIFTIKLKYLSKMARLLKFKKPKNLYLSKNALKRKNNWLSEEEIINSYKNKKFFQNWDLNSLKNYISDGIIKTDKKIKLRCSPELESKIFEESENLILSKVINNLTLPTYLYLAEYNSPCFAKKNFEKNKNVKKVFTINNSDHFFPITKSNLFTKILFKDLEIE